jgi:hypothetical protein
MMAESRSSGTKNAAIARQRRDKHVSGATNSDETIEDAVFSMQSKPSLYSENQQQHRKRLKSPRAVRE